MDGIYARDRQASAHSYIYTSGTSRYLRDTCVQVATGGSAYASTHVKKTSKNNRPEIEEGKQDMEAANRGAATASISKASIGSYLRALLSQNECGAKRRRALARLSIVARRACELVLRSFDASRVYRACGPRDRVSGCISSGCRRSWKSSKDI